MAGYRAKMPHADFNQKGAAETLPTLSGGDAIQCDDKGHFS